MVKSTIKDHKRVEWRDCTELAIDTMSAIVVDHISHLETVEEWHILLKENGDYFAHPNPFIAAGDIPEPPFFTEFPKAKIAFLHYADDLALRGELSAQIMTEYINETFVPNVLDKHNRSFNP